MLFDALVLDMCVSFAPVCTTRNILDGISTGRGRGKEVHDKAWVEHMQNRETNGRSS
jgi:hypothetical protein